MTINIEGQSINWGELRLRHESLSSQLLAPDLDNETRKNVQREHSHLANILAVYDDIVHCEQALMCAYQQRDETKDQELVDLFNEEIADLEVKKANAERALEDVLYPPNELDECAAFLEIRAGAGGLEASLFAADLLRMYANYALRRGWQASVVSEHKTDLKGYKEVVLHFEAKGAYGALKRESGVHRVQRVPATEGAGRVHTSTVTVAVLPEVNDEIELVINPADLRLDFFRASGAGGQHVNKTDSAVRITHLPTGVVVSCQEERSQHKNKAKAMSMLKSRLLTAQQEKQAAELCEKRRELVGTGSRSEKVRTYNFPQNRVTDHQVDLTLKKLDMVMEGDLDDIINALVEDERRKRRAQPNT
jgi:peptide chain release factor 1